MPLIVPMVRIVLSGEQPVVGMTAQDQVHYSMDLASPFIFSPRHFLFGRVAQEVYNNRMSGVGLERDSYVGFVAIILSFIAVRRLRKVCWLWIWCGAVFFILALGPYLSEFYRSIASSSASYSIMDLPFEPGFSFYHYYQIYHRKKIIYGHIARTPYQLLREKQGRFRVSQQYDPEQPEKNLEFLRRFIHGMRQANERYIVIHKEVTTPRRWLFWAHS